MLKNYKFVSKNLVKIKSNNNYIKKGHVHVKQAEMLCFHCGPSRQENVLIRLDQNEQN